MDEAMSYKHTFARLKNLVLPKWQANAEEERKRTGIEKGEHQNRLQTWWLLKRPREQMLQAILPLNRFIACARVTKRPIFEFLSSRIRPDSSLTVFSFADDYSFGILQSGLHWAWFTAKCSTLTERFRYTSDTVFDTFPWPQAPTLNQIRAVADAACALRALRRETMQKNHWPLRELYKTLETPGENKMRDAQDALDATVRAAYGMNTDEDILPFLLKLNLELAEKESAGKSITPPGLPAFVEKPKDFITADCVTPP